MKHSTDHFNQAKCRGYKIKWMYGITCRAWHRDALNSLDALPVVPCRRLIPCLPRPHAGSSRFPIWRRQGRRPWHTAEIMWPICPLPHSGNWFKMAAKIEWDDLGRSSWYWWKTNKMKAKANSKGAKIMQECNYKPQEYSRMKYRSYFLFNDLHLFFVWTF